MRRLCIILIAFCLCGCWKSSTPEEYETDKTEMLGIDVSGDNFLEIMPMVKSYRFIPLETADDCIIGEINKVQYANNRYYILDRRQRKQIFVFDENGRFLMPVSKTGRGPGEYIEPTDFYVTDSTIVVYDMFTHKLNCYNPDGAYIGNRILPYKIYEIEESPCCEGIYAVTGDNRTIKDIDNFEILELSQDNNVEARYYHNKYTINFSNEYDLHTFNGNIIYAKPFRPGVFAIDGGGIYLKYGFNIKPLPLPADFEKVCNGDFTVFRAKYADSYAYFNGQYWETANYVGVGVNYRRLPYLSIYDKTSKKLHTGIVGIRYGLDSEDVNGVLTTVLNNSSLCVDGNIITGIIPPAAIPKNLRTGIFNTEYDSDFRNPVIVRMEFEM